MPLAFPSESHGIIAFGFFNIETDLLLLEEHFFFADRFCAEVVSLAEAAAASLDAWRVDRARIGDLHGAIAGVDLSGLIGACYQRFPFPARREDFKQSPEGASNRDAIVPLLERFGTRESVQLAWDREGRAVTVGELRFREEAFAMLIEYVDRGGYPRWRGELRPPYVRAMMDRLAGLSSPWCVRDQ